MKKHLTKDQLKAIIEHDYHQTAFSRENFLNQLMKYQKIALAADKDYCPKSPNEEHEWGEPIPGLAGNTGFECKHCEKFEWDD